MASTTNNRSARPSGRTLAHNQALAPRRPDLLAVGTETARPSVWTEVRMTLRRVLV
jgi:hypothetical protein